MKLFKSYCVDTVSKVAAISVMAVTISSCTEVLGIGYEVDWTPVVMDISVRDRYGNDLLNPDYPYNIIEGSTITFQGSEYAADCEQYKKFISSSSPSEEENNDEQKPATKAILPIMNGFVLMNGEMVGNESISGFFMRFGEIDGAADMDETLVVKWGDGTTDEIRYVCNKHKEGRNPTCNRYFYLNGTKVSSPKFSLVH